MPLPTRPVPARYDHPSRESPTIHAAPTAPLPILARADDWVVVAKPAHLMVHRSRMAPREPAYALQLVRRMMKRRVYPVHRLDRPASGCLLFTTDRTRVHGLQHALRDGVKRYLVFVRGHVPTRETVEVDRPMKDDQGVLRDAHTTVRCVASCPDPRSSLFVAWPRTGRYHQVRRHVRDLSHPVLGDKQHGDTRVNRWWREERGLTRLGLHCLSLDLPLPDGGRVQATCPVPADLRELMSGLPWWDEALAAVPELALPPAEPAP